MLLLPVMSVTVMLIIKNGQPMFTPALSLHCLWNINNGEWAESSGQAHSGQFHWWLSARADVHVCVRAEGWGGTKVISSGVNYVVIFWVRTWCCFPPFWCKGEANGVYEVRGRGRCRLRPWLSTTEQTCYILAVLRSKQPACFGATYSHSKHDF